MASPQIAPHGAWKSPITPDLILAESVRLAQIEIAGDVTYWIESRPAEKGRYVIVRQGPGGERADVTPQEFNARTRAHEYGGGALIAGPDLIFYSNFADQRLYRQSIGGEPEPITPEGDIRYADGVYDAVRDRVVCVCEDHSTGASEAANSIVSLDARGRGKALVLASGHDFYSTPRLNPAGDQLTWLAWNHPNMPWDGTELWVAPLNEAGAMGEGRLVCGGEAESIFQPCWSPDGVLYFVSDRTGWWNLYRERAGEIEPLCPREAEFGRPQWNFGVQSYGFASTGELICSFVEDGRWRLARLDTESLELVLIAIDYGIIGEIRVGGRRALLAAGSTTRPQAIVEVDIDSGRTKVLRETSSIEIDDGYISPARAIEFPTEGGLTAHAFFYPPNNRDFRAPEGEKPPVLVMIHGGPTSATTSALSPSLQYWTSRGVAVCDVNYGGSTGYGREYRERLKDNWGTVDVDDCVNAVRYLAELGEIDPERAAIRGGSAGGYTTLAALTFRDTFRAGASYYGVSDLEALARDTHKFESRYLDGLVGPYPEARDLYLKYSPIHSTDRLSCPIILFQGLEDKVVPPSQAEQMLEAVRAKGLPVAYVAYEGEQHGFRQSKNIKHAMESELYFYSRIFGFELADAVAPIKIENLD